MINISCFVQFSETELKLLESKEVMSITEYKKIMSMTPLMKGEGFVSFLSTSRLVYAVLL